MKFGSVCSGIEAASVAWHSLGWQPAWFAEIEPFPSAVLAHHYPSVSNLGDMTTIAKQVLTGAVEAPDLLCGGTPCQAFSVAGLRESLADERGNLTLKFVELADAVDHIRIRAGKPAAIVFWENVPGVLSTSDNAFGCFLAGLAGEDEPLIPPGGKWTNSGCVHGPSRSVAWRTLDAQYFGVAQRRRRVFVVASARNDFDPAAVLFEWDGVRRDSAPSREAGENLADRAGAGAYLGNAEGGSVDVPFMTASSQMRCVNNQTPLVGVTQPEAFVKATNPHSAEEAPRYEQTEVAACLNPWDERHNPPKHMVAVAIGLDEEQNARVEGFGTLKARMEGGGFEGTVMTPAMQVRRLTPVECERLQGFPDNYTAIPWRNKPADQCPDGPRYKALGNSWAVPVVQWIGRRIASAVEMRMAA